jgi:hypothetical protein
MLRSNSIRTAPTPDTRSATHGGRRTIGSCPSVIGSPNASGGPEMDRMTRIGEAEQDSLSGSAQAPPLTRVEHLAALAAILFIVALVIATALPALLRIF